MVESSPDAGTADSGWIKPAAQAAQTVGLSTILTVLLSFGFRTNLGSGLPLPLNYREICGRYDLRIDIISNVTSIPKNPRYHIFVPRFALVIRDSLSAEHIRYSAVRCAAEISFENLPDNISFGFINNRLAAAYFISKWLLSVCHDSALPICSSNSSPFLSLNCTSVRLFTITFSMSSLNSSPS